MHTHYHAVPRLWMTRMIAFLQDAESASLPAAPDTASLFCEHGLAVIDIQSTCHRNKKMLPYALLENSKWKQIVQVHALLGLFF